MARGRVYPPETKAAAIAMAATGNTASFVAAELGLPRATVQRWVEQANLPAVIGQSVGAKKGAQVNLGELFAAYLSEVLNTLRAQAEAFRDPAWLAKQSAGDAAVLHGVLADKLLRVVSSLEPADETIIETDVVPSPGTAAGDS